jgi:hypothetical protein
VIAILLDLSIWRSWPISELWVIGLFIGIDLIINGWTEVMLAVMARPLSDRLSLARHVVKIACGDEPRKAAFENRPRRVGRIPGVDWRELSATPDVRRIVQSQAITNYSIRKSFVVELSLPSACNIGTFFAEKFFKAHGLKRFRRPRQMES